MKLTSVASLRSSDISAQDCLSELLSGQISKFSHGHLPAHSELTIVLRDLAQVALKHLESAQISHKYHLILINKAHL